LDNDCRGSGADGQFDIDALRIARLQHQVSTSRKL
jgi:hypothetical protein